MSQVPNQKVIDMLTKVLDEAKRGEISSAVLLTMNGKNGHVGYWSRISRTDDAEAVPGHMEVMKHQLLEMLQEAK
jgi:hypothetical protein